MAQAHKLKPVEKIDDPLDTGAAAPPPEEVATFVADMTRQLTRMALGAQFDLLAQFLTMARVEAEMLSRMSRKR